MTPDKVVAIIGLVMSLILVLSNGVLRRMRFGTQIWMAAVWVAIILAAALAFAGYRH